MWLIDIGIWCIDFIMDLFILDKTKESYRKGHNPLSPTKTIIITVAIIVIASVIVALTR